MNFRLVSRYVAVAVLAGTSTACGAFRASDGDTSDTKIRYEVGHLSAANPREDTALSITFSTPDGMQEDHGVGLPWTTLVRAGGAGFTPSVTAQFDGFGTIECRIVADNKVIQQQTSKDEPYPVVKCSA